MPAVRLLTPFLFLSLFALAAFAQEPTAKDGDFGPGAAAPLDPPPNRGLTGTFYVAHMSGESGWEDVLVNPFFGKYVGADLAVMAFSKEYAQRRGGRLTFEWEGQVAFNFGRQEYWEFNAVPVVTRWHFQPWRGLQTSAAFGLGLSYVTEMPQIEVDLEGESHQTLVYWVMELTAGRPGSRWEVTARLHHRSVAYGLMGEAGGMNAMGLGLKWHF